MKITIDIRGKKESFRILLNEEYYNTLFLRDEMINYIMVRIAAIAFDCLKPINVTNDKDAITDCKWLEYIGDIK